MITHVLTACIELKTDLRQRICAKWKQKQKQKNQICRYKKNAQNGHSYQELAHKSSDW